MTKWIEATLAAIIWSWLMLLQAFKKSVVNEKRSSLASTYPQRSLEQHSVSLRA